MEELKVKASFGMKLLSTDEKRTEIAYTLDFSKLSREEIATYAEKEFSRILNNELRDKKRLLEDIQGKEIEVPVLTKGVRGAKEVSPEKAMEVLAKNLGISIEVFQALMIKAKGGVV